MSAAGAVLVVGAGDATGGWRPVLPVARIIGLALPTRLWLNGSRDRPGGG